MNINVNNLIPYVINLKTRTDRLNRMIPLLEQNFPQGYKIFEGIRSDKVEPNDKISIGQKGCFLSHLAIIKQAQSLQLPYVLILEDDIAFIDDFKTKFQQMFTLLPNSFDFFYLSGNHQHYIQMYKQDLINNLAIATCKRIYSTAAYIIHSKIYDELLQLPYNNPIDVEYSKIQQRGYTFTAIPSLCWQSLDDWSDVDSSLSSCRERDTRIMVK